MNNIFERNSIVSIVYPDQRHENVTLYILAKRRGNVTFFIHHHPIPDSFYFYKLFLQGLRKIYLKKLLCIFHNFFFLTENFVLLPIASTFFSALYFRPTKSSFSSSCLPFHPFFAPSCYRQLELFLVIHNKDFPLSSDLKLPP